MATIISATTTITCTSDTPPGIGTDTGSDDTTIRCTRITVGLLELATASVCLDTWTAFTSATRDTRGADRRSITLDTTIGVAMGGGMPRYKRAAICSAK